MYRSLYIVTVIDYVELLGQFKKINQKLCLHRPDSIVTCTG